MVKEKNPFVVALVNIAESQDIESFKKIFDYFSPRLKSFLMKSGAEEAIAEEIIQFASACGAYVCQKVGAIESQPSLHDIDQFLSLSNGGMS